MTTQPKFGEWIKCSERLPDAAMGDWVLVYCPRSDSWRDRRIDGRIDDKGTTGAIYVDEYSGLMGTKFTHWMPLPEPPNE